MDPGVRIHYREALRLFGDSGAEVDMESRLARIPRTLAEKAVETAPSSFSLYDYEGKPVVRYGGDDVHFDPSSAAIDIAAYEPLSLETGVLRELEGIASRHAKAAGLDHLPELSTG
jgi:trimethylamine--corrinoid protein Co-methyltransferase